MFLGLARGCGINYAPTPINILCNNSTFLSQEISVVLNKKKLIVRVILSPNFVAPCALEIPGLNEMSKHDSCSRPQICWENACWKLQKHLTVSGSHVWRPHSGFKRLNCCMKLCAECTKTGHPKKNYCSGYICWIQFEIVLNQRNY